MEIESKDLAITKLKPRMESTIDTYKRESVGKLICKIEMIMLLFKCTLKGKK